MHRTVAVLDKDARCNEVMPSSWQALLSVWASMMPLVLRWQQIYMLWHWLEAVDSTMKHAAKLPCSTTCVKHMSNTGVLAASR
jgi:hypothetical protein